MNKLKDKLLIDASQNADKIWLFALAGPVFLAFMSTLLSKIMEIQLFQDNLPAFVLSAVDVGVMIAYGICFVMFLIGAYLTIGWLFLRRLNESQRAAIEFMFSD
jgi:uncharacterized membrane protein YdbT with pleckstrin-like domain